jgi:hypothetical protein
MAQYGTALSCSGRPLSWAVYSVCLTAARNGQVLNNMQLHWFLCLFAGSLQAIHLCGPKIQKLSLNQDFTNFEIPYTCTQGVKKKFLVQLVCWAESSTWIWGKRPRTNPPLAVHDILCTQHIPLHAISDTFCVLYEPHMTYSIICYPFTIFSLVHVNDPRWNTRLFHCRGLIRRKITYLKVWEIKLVKVSVHGCCHTLGTCV